MGRKETYVGESFSIDDCSSVEAGGSKKSSLVDILHKQRSAEANACADVDVVRFIGSLFDHVIIGRRVQDHHFS